MKTVIVMCVLGLSTANLCCVERGGIAKSKVVSDSRTSQVPNDQETSEKEINDVDLFAVYGSLLVAVRNNYAFDDPIVDHLGAKDLLVYRNETVHPEQPERIEHLTNSELDRVLLTNFQEVNRQSVHLEDDYEMLDWTESNSGNQDIQLFFKETAISMPRVRAVVSFSRIGMNLQKGQGLVYVEYYSQKVGTLKFYLLLMLDAKSTDEKSPHLTGATVSKVFRV